MLQELLRFGLFGYTKVSVCEYIAKANEEFSEKLMAKDEAHAAELQTLHEQLNRLEAENKELHTKQDDIANVMMSARQYAADILKEAKDRDKQLRQASQELNQAELACIEQLAANVDSLRDSIRKTMDKMDRELDWESKALKELAVTPSPAAPETDEDAPVTNEAADEETSA